MAKAPYRPPVVQRQFGLADWIGFVVAAVALTVIPGLADPLTAPKLLVLSVGAFAALPATILRWRALDRPTPVLLVPISAAAGLLLWSIISTLLSGAPWAISLIGWWGRGDGLIAFASAVILLLAASTLEISGVQRVITWLLWGAALVAAIGLLEALGIQVISGTYAGVDATLGNPNFAAGFVAITAVLAVGRAIEPGRDLWVRIGSGVLAAALALMSYLTGSLQGPAALAVGIGAGWVIWVLAYRGPRRVLALGATGAVVVVSLVLLALSLVDIGPLKILWADYTVQVRQQYWQAAWNMTTGLPIFGSGPDGFARYVSEFRPESYIELLGPVRRVSAAHNIALQFGATLGLLGLLLWIVLMGSLAILLLIRAGRAQITPVVTVAAVGGAWTAYIVQGMVSIDMIPLLALGWLVTGLLIASLRGSTSAPQPKTSVGITVGAGAGVALIPLVLVSMSISSVQAATTVQSLDQAAAVLSDPQTPCPLRVQIAQAVIGSGAGDVGEQIVLDSYSLDPRCAPMVSFASEIALARGDLELADELTSVGVSVDPLFSVAWLYRAQYELAVGDLPAARAALDEAARLDALYPELTDAAPPDISAQLADLRSRIEAAGG